MQMLCFIRLCLIFLTLAHFSAADRSTMERIRKHQEWLKQRNQQKASGLSASNYKTSFELANLWRFQKESPLKQKLSLNEVYPENDSNSLNVTAARSVFPTVSSPVSNETTTITPSDVIVSAMQTDTTTTTPITTSTTESNVTPIFTTNRASNEINDVNAKSSTTTTTTSAATTPTEAPHSTTTSPTKHPKPKLRPYPRWANWSQWSDCSRSCGGGVMFQTRKCLNRNSSTGKRFISNDCIGLFKRYKLCNEQACADPSRHDIRSAQCAAFDDVDFQGRRYNWEPYIKDDAECELNCKPLGMKYFATLNETVIDGTPCNRPAEYYRSNYTSRAICVDGICKAIQASGEITGLYANSGSVSCGGLICRPVTGIFTRDPLPEDAYVHVATIPAGASNISITELKSSQNLLVLRTIEQKYVFNGENAAASDSGVYEAVGSLFDYHRIDGLEHSDGVTEWITCTGPIRDSVELLIYSKALNPGIKYEYLLPITSDSEENELSLENDGFLKSGNEDSSVSSSRSTRRRKFNWKVVGFSACTKSCGGGTQTPIVRCVRENPVRYYSQRRCLHAEKPVLNENLLRCNTQPCPAYWRFDNWSECRCQQGEGYRHRELSCVQELASGIVIHVDNAACMEEPPPAKKQCECPKNRRRSHSRYRTHGSLNRTQNGRYRVDKNSNGGVWLMSDWNQYCSVDCGPGVEYRTIFCDRSKQNSERCDSRTTPEISRPCDSKHTCDMGEWFAGPWSPCNGNCFNLTRSRQVLCIQNQLITDDEDCKAVLRPQTTEKCLHEQVEYCAPRWHYSEWTECTKSCDGGTQRRSTKCLEYDEATNALRDSTKCRYSLREPIYRSCNTEKCEEAKLEQLQNDAAAICVDEFTNCQWAVKAKLCNYDYYRENCCYSCSGGV